MVCTQCGANIQDGQAVCGVCGTQFVAQTTQYPQVSKPVNHIPPPVGEIRDGRSFSGSASQKSKNGKGVLIALVIAGVCFLAGVVSILFAFKDDLFGSQVDDTVQGVVNIVKTPDNNDNSEIDIQEIPVEIEFEAEIDVDTEVAIEETPEVIGEQEQEPGLKELLPVEPSTTVDVQADAPDGMMYIGSDRFGWLLIPDTWIEIEPLAPGSINFIQSANELNPAYAVILQYVAEPPVPFLDYIADVRTLYENIGGVILLEDWVYFYELGDSVYNLMIQTENPKQFIIIVLYENSEGGFHYVASSGPRDERELWHEAGILLESFRLSR